MSILERIVATKRREIDGLQPRRQELAAAAAAAPPPSSLADALLRPNEVALVAEVKRRSPSAGPIRADLEPREVAEAYASAGAAAVSVLTDFEYFGGALSDLEEVRSAVDVPVLRKDFVLDVAQVWEARSAGADAVLLIVRVLPNALLTELLRAAREVGMEPLVEVHDAAELERALAAGARVVGVNNRDLGTFAVDLSLAERLARETPRDVVLVAESGIGGRADVERLGDSGVDAVLVGESLMRASDVRAAAAALTGVAKARRH